MIKEVLLNLDFIADQFEQELVASARTYYCPSQQCGFRQCQFCYLLTHAVTLVNFKSSNQTVTKLRFIRLVFVSSYFERFKRLIVYVKQALLKSKHQVQLLYHAS